VAKDEFGALFGIEATDEQTQRFNQILRQNAAMAVKFAEYKAQQMVQKLQQQFDPALNTVKQIQQKSLENQFATKHPDLVRYRPLVQNVVAQMKAEGKTFPNAEQAIEAAAQRTRQILQQSGVTIEQANQTQQGNQQQRQPQVQTQQRQRPATASTGGGGGANNSASPTQNSVQNIWG
jgi:DNA-binding ferritin-like protein